jgi:hypothetical protein
MYKEVVLAAVLVATLSPLLVNQAFAHEIMVFAPLKRALSGALIPVYGKA